MLIHWLLKYDGYPPGVVVALLVHGILLYIFMPKEFDPANQVTIQPASYVVASAVTQSPQRLRRLEQQTQRRNEEAERERQRQREQQAAREQQREAERQRQQQAEAERQRQQEAERQRVAEENRQREQEAERSRQEEADRQRRAEQERQRQETAQREAAEAAARAAAEAAAQQQLSVENQMIAQYMSIIRELVSNAWSRPPSARNGMQAVVQLRLAPTGEVIDSVIVSSSGDPAFDRSVLQAVDRVGSFSELQEMPTPIFERSFRTFNLSFSPEDLLR